MIRRACALAGLLALFLQGSNGGHMLLVEHSRCAEHGELVHTGEAHHHDASAHVETGGPAFENVSDDASEAAHEHCALMADRRDALAAVVEAQVSSCRIEAAEGVRPPEPFALVADKRFRVAPKNSPPA
jgi:hypothetical protein